ncbi:sensor histidine kinase [Hungatella sp. L12]|uniref:Sensor histidine kinase n=1 Tax=Hungatella hominis TaxID=2763050 RepID=A0ABR7HE02_9FIRM|nr:sensor histidine kinase [Hungatella hominis]MBC5711385.1 sensor histidine kinase [Hungatella hominis]
MKGKRKKGKLRTKLMMTYCTLILLYAVACSAVLYFGTQYMVINDEIDRAKEVNGGISASLDSFLRIVDRMAIQISADDTIQQIMKADYTSVENSLYFLKENQSKAFKLMEGFRSISPNIAGIFLYRNDGYKYFDYSRNLSMESIEENSRQFRDEFIQRGDYKAIIGPYNTRYDNVPSRRAITLIRRIPNVDMLFKTRQDRELGFISIEIEVDQLINEIISFTDLGISGDFMILSEEGQVIYSTRGEKAPRLDKKMIQSLRGDESSIYGKYMGEDTLFTCSISPYTDWSVISFVAKKELRRPVKKVGSYMLIAGITGVLLAGAVTVVISRNIVRPVYKIKDMLGEIEKGKFGGTVAIDTNDELSLLGEGYNRMSLRLSKLIEEIYESEEKKRKAEIVALQSQINPHFIYNTLSTIRQMAAIQQRKGIEDMAECLIKLLRSAARYENELITISDEIDLLRAYIYIQETRYVGKFFVSIDVADDVLNCLTINLILQPVVENAIFHGIVPKKGSGTIRITVMGVGEDIEYQVHDDGVGMNLMMWKEILEHPQEDDYQKLGIYNVQRRLQLSFGKDYGLSLKEGVKEGTTIIIRIPRKNRE